MKNKILKTIQPMLLALSAACLAGTAQAQIFLGAGDSIGEYSTSGATINASLISGLSPANTAFISIALDGNGRFVHGEQWNDWPNTPLLAQPSMLR